MTVFIATLISVCQHPIGVAELVGEGGGHQRHRGGEEHRVQYVENIMGGRDTRCEMGKGFRAA